MWCHLRLLLTFAPSGGGTICFGTVGNWDGGEQKRGRRAAVSQEGRALSAKVQGRRLCVLSWLERRAPDLRCSVSTSAWRLTWSEQWCCSPHTMIGKRWEQGNESTKLGSQWQLSERKKPTPFLSKATLALSVYSSNMPNSSKTSLPRKINENGNVLWDLGILMKRIHMPHICG